MNLYFKTAILIATLLISVSSTLTALTNVSDRFYTPMLFRYLVPVSNHLVLKGNQIILSGKKSAFLKLNAISNSALQLSPLNTPALYQRGIWFSGVGLNKKALSTMALAEKISRRNMAVNFWFIQWYAAHGQIDELLDHYDYALRTNKDISTSLFPALTLSLEVPEGRAYFAKKIRQEPFWIYSALEFAISNGSNPSNVAESLIIAKGLPAGEKARRVENILIGSLIGKNQMLLARRYYLSLRRAKPDILGEVNFSNNSVDAALSPMAWGGINSQNASGEFVLEEGTKKQILRASALENNHGLVARRLFFPEFGQYKIMSNAIMKGSPKVQLFFALKCVIGNEVREFYRAQVNTAVPMPLLKIDKGCDAVFFEIELDSGEGQVGSQLELRHLSMEKVQ
jgi:tetratricopeptide (TPR) repeat protein